MSRAKKIGILVGFLFSMISIYGVFFYDDEDAGGYAKGVIFGSILSAIVWIPVIFIILAAAMSSSTT